MTVGPAAGYPDWQTYAQWGAALVGDQNFTANNGGSVSVLGAQVPQWGAVLIRTGVVVGSGALQVTVLNPLNGGTVLYANSWSLTTNGPQVAVLIPTFGGTVDVSVIEGTGAGSISAHVSVMGANERVTQPVYLGPQNWNIQDGVSVPASGDLLLPLPWVATGRMGIQVTQAGSGTVGQLQTEQLFNNGTWGIFALLGQNLATGTHAYELPLPGTPMRLRLRNFNTTAVTNVYAGVWTDTA